LGIGFSGQMHGLVLLDRGKRLLRPAIIWADQRSADLLPEIEALKPIFDSLERFSKEISEKRKKVLVLLQVNSNKVVIAPSRGRAQCRERHAGGIEGGDGGCAHSAQLYSAYGDTLLAHGIGAQCSGSAILPHRSSATTLDRDV
jgi:hypothetical protein